MTDPGPRTAALIGLVAAMAIAVIVLAAVGSNRPPILCAECEDPYRPQSTSCGDEWNPTTTPGGFANLACDL